MPDFKIAAETDPRANAVLTISIDGVWTALAFARELEAINFFYQFAILTGYRRDPIELATNFKGEEYRLYSNWMEDPGNLDPLIVGQFVFHSPGIQDFFGVAGALQQIRDFIFDLIRLRHDAETHAVQLAKGRAEVEALELKNLQTKLDILKSIGATRRERAEIAANWEAHREVLVRSVVHRNITDVEMTRFPPENAPIKD